MPEQNELEYVVDEDAPAPITPQQAIVRIEPDPLVLTPVMNLSVAKARLAEFQDFIRGYLVDGEDFGIIPGTPKATLLQPGADKLSEIYGLAPTFPADRQKRFEDWKAEPPLFDYESTCVLISRRNGQTVAEGQGSCNSYEGKYRWREKQRVCPECQKEAIIKGKEEFGGGWLCWKKKGGCGAKFKDGDAAIESQDAGKVPNDDIATLKNTILKMANKRAKIAAVITATRSSGIFTQDVEDIASGEPVEQKPSEVSQVKRKVYQSEGGAVRDKVIVTPEAKAAAAKGKPKRDPAAEANPFKGKNQPTADDEQWLRENG